MSNGFSIKIFLPDGKPEGLRVIEKSNWNGWGLLCSRVEFGQAKTRPEFSKPGVYILIGPSVGSNLVTAYIGEGDPAGERLKSHAVAKDFWTKFVLFTSKDSNLNKAHVQYLEARLVELASASKRCNLENGNQPARPALSEIDVAEAEGFLGEMLLCFPTLGIDFFETVTKSEEVTSELLRLHAKGVTAQGYESAQGFVIKSGSRAIGTETTSCPPYIVGLRKTLSEKGILKPDGNGLIFSQDFVFNSPSAAGAVVIGGAISGPEAWKDASEKTLKQIQSSAAAE